MDSVTQAALGAVVGEAVAGPRIGNRALLLGAVAGTLPDLDVLATLFAGDVERFTGHRALTHSLVVAPFAAWLLAPLCARALPRIGLARGQWLHLLLGCLVTHIMVDLCTVYGTRIFYPLSDHPFALSNLFIIDPFYTLPLLAAIIWVLAVRRAPGTRRRATLAALALSTAYLVTGLALKVHAGQVFADALAERGVEHRGIKTMNTPFNIVLWRALAVTDDGYWQGWYSVLAPEAPPVLEKTPAHPERASLDALAADSPELARLMDFSRGYYFYEDGDDGVDWVDLRMGAGSLYMFRFRVAERDGGDLLPTSPVRRRSIRPPSIESVWAELYSRLPRAEH